MKLFGHRIIATASPWMATQDATTSQVDPFERTMLLDGVHSITGTCGSESTRWRQQWRDAGTIEIDWNQKEKGEEGGDA